MIVSASTLSVRLAIGLLAFAAAGFAEINVSLIPSAPAPQPVGSVIRWTADAVNTNPGPTTYRFEVGLASTGEFSVVKDFTVENFFEWSPTAFEGEYIVRVTARDFLAGETAEASQGYAVTSRVVGGMPTVSITQHPLVALFAVPPCAPNVAVRVRFQREGSSKVQVTNFRPCSSDRSTNILVGGLQQRSTYVMNFDLWDGGNLTAGPGGDLLFFSGVVPAAIDPPGRQVLSPPGPASSAAEDILLWSLAPPGTPNATDLAGNIIWYLNPDVLGQIMRPLPGGRFMVIASGLGTGTGPYGPNPNRQHILAEVDLAGNVIREVSADRISEQLMAMGEDGIGRLNHDALLLPDGRILALADSQRVFPAGTRGSPEPIALIGATIVLLDPNFNVLWSWNSFDHAGGAPELNVERGALRGETCRMTNGRTQLGCPPVLLPGFTEAGDWLHANSLQIAADGNIIMSLRNQDWVIKIDYQDATGTGDVLWRLGMDGDFTISSSDVYPWFSAQHEAAFEFGGMRFLSLYDNGNSRTRLLGGNSRGQVFDIDEEARTAALVVNSDLGVFAGSQGSAQPLSNFNWTFHSGAVSGASGLTSQPAETTPRGFIVYNIQTQIGTYRSWRMQSFYFPPKT